jgi:hypothetical protein
VLGKSVPNGYKSNRRSIEHQFDTSRGATMSTATISRPTPAGRTASPQVRPVRRSAPPVRGPLARPDRVVPAPSARTAQAAAIHSCRLPAGAGDTPTWRLTDRGIALVLVLAAMIVVAALTVVGLTAWQVTGPGERDWSATVGSR